MKAYKQAEISEAPETCGVYVIYLTSNPNKGYIGSTNNFRRRFKQHKDKLQSRKHSNYKLNRLWPRNSNEFRFAVLEECPDAATSRTREQTHIDFLGPKKLYNIDLEVKKHRSD